MPLEAHSRSGENLIADAFSFLVQITALSTTSLSSSILDYRRENGRTYHKFRDGSS